MAGRDWSEGSDSSIEETKLCVGGGSGGETDVCMRGIHRRIVCVCFVGKGERCVCEGDERGVYVRGKGERCVREGEEKEVYVRGKGECVSDRHIQNMTIKGIS